MICLKKGLLFLPLVFGSSTAPPTDGETMLVDFVPFFKAPLKIAIFVCWTNEKSANLVRRLMGTTQHPLLMQLRNDSIENIALLDTLEPHQHLAVIDGACPNSERFLAEAAYRIYYRVRWILLDSSVGSSDGGSKRESDMLRLVSGLEVTGICELFYFAWSDDGDLLVRDENRCAHGAYHQYHCNLAKWNIRRPSNRIVHDCKATDSYAFGHKDYSCLHDKLHSYTRHFDDYENPQIDTAARTSYHVCRILYDFYLNATLKKVYRTSWCYPNMPGICSDFASNLSEAGGALMFMSQPRLKQVAFLKMPIAGNLRFIFKAPNLSLTDNIFKLPFNIHVWSCTLLLIILVGGLFLIARLVSRRDYSEHLQLGDAVFNVISITFQQGFTSEVNGIGQKGLILVTLIGLMFLEVSFSAKIISLIQAPSEKINTLKDLLESKMKVACHDAIYNRHHIATATEPIRRALYEKKILLKTGLMNLYGVDEGMKRVRKGLFAYHVYSANGYQKVSETFDEAEKCYLRELTFVTSSIAYLPVKLNYTFREHFNVGLMRMLETGIYSRLHNKMHYSKPSCVKPVSFRPLSVVDIRFAFDLIGGGLMAGLLILVAEVMRRKYRISRIQILQYLE